MNNYFFLKILAYSYILVLTIAFLIPLESTIVTVVIHKENHPSDLVSLFIHLILLFLLYFIFEKIILQKFKLLIFCIIYSIFIEVFQSFTGRGYENLDMIFNLLGVFLGYFSSVYLNKYFLTFN